MQMQRVLFLPYWFWGVVCGVFAVMGPRLRRPHLLEPVGSHRRGISCLSLGGHGSVR
jgi:hypothetical protein